MKINLNKIIMVIIILLMIGSLYPAIPCEAASATVNIAADNTEITVGDNIFVYVKIDSDTQFGDFETNVTYDEDILEYRGGASVITGGSGFLKISDMNVLEGDTSRKYTLKFEALKPGLCTIAFDGAAAVYDFTAGTQMSVSSSEITLKVKAPMTASTNAYLKSLEISPTELNPVFDKNIFEYNVTVGYDTQQLIIAAEPEDQKSTVSISGNDLLQEGENKVTVSVLAESGDVIKYNINVYRQTASEALPTPEPSVTPSVGQNSFDVVLMDGEKYAICNDRYQLLEPGSDVQIPEGYQKTTLTLCGIPVTAYLPVNDGESEFVLLYAMNEMGDTGFYQYDRVEQTIQRFRTDSWVINNSTETNAEDESALARKYNDNLNTAAIIIALLAAFSGLLLLITVRLIFKLKGYKSDDLE